jgi:2-phosphosulfolactate phosphatase
MPEDYFSQLQYRVRLDWGRDGARRAAERGDILVIVDVLRFSTTVVSILRHEGIVAPCSWEDDPFAFAAKVGGEVATSRRDAPSPSRFSLSPRAYGDLEPGTRIVLPSPNGATCSRLGAQVPYLFVGALVNARAVAAIARRILHAKSLELTVIACGERWERPGEDGALRFAVEDYLGAGAILSHLAMGMSPEAEICTHAFQSVADNLAPILLRCGSGIELNVRDASEDVLFAARSDTCPIVPVLRDGWFVPWRDEFLTAVP